MNTVALVVGYGVLACWVAAPVAVIGALVRAWLRENVRVILRDARTLPRVTVHA